MKFFRKSKAAPDGYSPITQFHPQDVFVAGYPKSGNTWLQELISAVVFGVEPELCSPLLLQEVVPDVHLKTFYQRYQTPMFFKTHALPRPEYRRVVHLIRDGRDVMTSYYHYNLALANEPVDFMKMVKEGYHCWPCRWHEHVQAWMANPYGATVLTVRYEELQKDVTREMLRFCEFFGIERDRSFVERMSGGTAFEKMQRKEAREKIYLNPRWPTDKRFRRRGQVGSHRDEMPPEILEAFVAEAGPTLRDCGYGDDSQMPTAHRVLHCSATLASE